VTRFLEVKVYKPIRLGGRGPRIGWITHSKQPYFLLPVPIAADPYSSSHGGPLPNGYFLSIKRSWIVNCQEPQSFKRLVLISWFPFTSPLDWFLPLRTLRTILLPTILCPTLLYLSPVGMFWTSLFGFTAFFVSLVVLRVLRFFWRSARSPLRQLPGPCSTSWLYGNVREYTEAGQTVLWDHWIEIYGKTFKFATFFNVSPFFYAFGLWATNNLVLTVLTPLLLLLPQAPALYTTDVGAMGYILSHQDEFVKTTDIKIALTLLGEGMVFLGCVHITRLLG